MEKGNDARSLRIVYMGTPDFAVAPLDALIRSGHNVVAVVTTPDKPAGRGLKMRGSAVKEYAAATGLPVLQPVRLRDEEFLETLRGFHADLGIVVAFRMLPREVYGMPRLGTFNLHASLLPQYRGAAPINWAVINGDTESGVTTFMLNARMDEGAVIASRRVPIEETDNAGSLHDKLMALGAELVVESVGMVAGGDFVPVPQPELPASEMRPAPKIFRETGHIDFSKPGRETVNLIRGLSPYPGAWCDFVERDADGAELRRVSLKIYAAYFEAVETDAASAGEVTVAGGRLLIACRDGYIIPSEVQPSGKQRMDAGSFLNGLKTRGLLTAE